MPHLGYVSFRRIYTDLLDDVVRSTEDERREFLRLIHVMTRRRRRQTLPTSMTSQLVMTRRDARHHSVQRHVGHTV